MATPAKTAAALLLLAGAQALVLQGSPKNPASKNPASNPASQNAYWVNAYYDTNFTIRGDYIEDHRHRDSKPGTPAVPSWTDDTNSPILKNFSLEPWRLELGDRLVSAASAADAMQKCGAFLSTGDYTWCKKAMPAEGYPGYKIDYVGVHEYNVSTSVDLAHQPQPDKLSALSFGIEGGDVWSEFMSGLYFLRTDLHDCYYGSKKWGPYANDQHGNHSRKNPCMYRKCYTEEYNYHKVCIDDTSNVRGIHSDSSGRQFQSVLESLRGKEPLSTFIKMDIEGSEWAALERLLDSEEDLAKVRTLDMEVHFNLEPNVVDEDKDKTENVGLKRVVPTKETLTRHVETMERLARYFAVSGSTIENDLGRAVEHFEDERKRDPHFVTIPSFVASRNGLRLDQYCISFVNRKLL